MSEQVMKLLGPREYEHLQGYASIILETRKSNDYLVGDTGIEPFLCDQLYKKKIFNKPFQVDPKHKSYTLTEMGREIANNLYLEFFRNKNSLGFLMSYFKPPETIDVLRERSPRPGDIADTVR